MRETPGRPESVNMIKSVSGVEFQELKDNGKVDLVLEASDGFAPGYKIGLKLWILNRDSSEREGLLAVVSMAEDTDSGRQVTLIRL